MKELVDADLNTLLYDKSYTCPLCGKNFTSKAIRVGKNQVTTIDSDLYAHYSLINPLLYDIILCPHCGYSTFSKAFGVLLPKQKDWLNELLASKAPCTYKEPATIEDAILKHKMALLASITKKSKISEQAYLALHIAWLYRDLKDTANEETFLSRSLDGFIESLSKETYPLYGIDEPTIMYMISDIAFRLGKLDICKQYLSIVLTSTNPSNRIKDRALDLKTKIYKG